MSQTPPNERARAYAQYAPWLLAIGGLVVALVFARADGHPPCSTRAAELQLSVDADGLGVERPHILVNGIASIDVVPDVVDVTVVLSVERSSAGEAVSTMRSQQTDLVEALGNEGITGIDLRVSQMSVSPVYDDRPGHNRRIRGYVSSISFVATLHEFDSIGEVLERASGFEVSNLSTRFRSTQMPAKKRALRDMALVAARDKARQSSAALDVELGAVLSIEEVDRNDRGGWSVGNMIMNEYAADPTALEGSIPGAVTLTLTVEVEYALVPGELS